MLPTASTTQGTVYLIHFDSPLSHARHYLGFTTNLKGRLYHHHQNRGARLLTVLNQLGIKWYLARTWQGDRSLERRLKNRKEAPTLCPACKIIKESGPKGKFYCQRCCHNHYVTSQAGKEHYRYG